MSKASSKIVLLKTLFDVGFVENGTNYIGVEERKKKREKKKQEKSRRLVASFLEEEMTGKKMTMDRSSMIREIVAPTLHTEFARWFGLV